MGLAACLYFIVGCCGYLTFKDRTAGDLLRNLGAAHVVVSGILGYRKNQLNMFAECQRLDRTRGLT